MDRVTCLLLLACFGIASGNAFAGESPSPGADTDVATAIDGFIDGQLSSAGITPAPPAEWYNLLRRTTLDLAGRIPTRTEYDWYPQLPEETRRAELVDRLMAMPDCDLHLRNCLDELLLANKPYDGEFREYLLWAVQQQRPWHLIFRDILLARDTEGPEKGAAQFLKSRARELDDLTNDTAVLFFGVNISCAKCHDHPLVADWKQDHFYGMQAFFSRTFATRKQILTEKPFGEVKFKTTAGEEKPASFMFLTGDVVEDRTPDFPEDERKQLEEQFRKLERDENAGYIVYPTFSPRRELADIAVKDDKEQFLAKNIVNRTWARLMGIGIVDPPDQMHSGNPPSHPELLQWLARDLTAHNYDLKRLIRGIVLSNAYARTSEWSSEAEAPAATTFAVAASRPLTPRQLATSLLVAVRQPEQWPAVDAVEEWERVRRDLENQSDGWSRSFEQPTPGFQVAVDEALFFSNNDRIQNDLLRDSGDRLIHHLKTLNDADTVQQLWVSVLNRTPADDEQQ
ncbi:MAG: DUF1553 domain-containing protein, partial [Planctomycetaceae bacterium]|nr:DUF1553 domain-containing protein [Planctomycetaceae bacterium]